MNATKEQIEHEFRRQVYLCKGIGRERMRELVDEQSAHGSLYVCQKCGQPGSFLSGHICKPASSEGDFHER